MLHNGQEKREVNNSNISTPGELKNVTLFVDKGITVVFKREQEKLRKGPKVFEFTFAEWSDIKII